MKKITDSRVLLGVDKNAALKDLKSVYRTLMKDWHPDKFADNHEQKLVAEEKSKEIIEAYHFLVSIAPETREEGKAEYDKVTATTIRDFSFKGQTLEINFSEGSNYEYFDVPRSVYQKMVNSDSPARFARRHVYSEFVYRKKADTVAAEAN